MGGVGGVLISMITQIVSVIPQIKPSAKSLPKSAKSTKLGQYLGNRRGNAVFVEYFVLALIIVTAAVAFHFRIAQGGDVHGQLEQAVDTQIANMTTPIAQNRMGLSVNGR